MDGAIDPEEVVRIIIGIFDCSDREKMSIAYKEIIEEEVRNILGGIENGNFEKDEFLSNAIGQFSHGKIKPMIDEQYGKGASEFFAQAIEAFYKHQ